MKVYHLRVNGIENPVGYKFNHLTFSWKANDDKSIYCKEFMIEISSDDKFNRIIKTVKNRNGKNTNNYSIELELQSRTRYFWRITIVNNLDEYVTSDVAYFETGKLDEDFVGKWISAKLKEEMPILFRNFTIKKKIIDARLYIYGLGIYEPYINDKKISNEYLQPGYHSYDLTNEYQTYDISDYLVAGENCISVLMGNGWYKGRFGFDGNYENIYGDKVKLIAEIVIKYFDNTEEIIYTDEKWCAKTSSILSNSIYDGESIDETKDEKSLEVEVLDDRKDLLCERSNPKIVITDRVSPIHVIDKKDYLIIDFGRVLTGWVEISGDFDSMQCIKLSYGELLQNDDFYNDNLRTAKAEFNYKSSGGYKTIRPHFTFYGFRYIKVEGINIEQDVSFEACEIMSDIERIGSIETSNGKINKLFQNTVNSQKSNFLDIPTDCPQRDERMGWTGDVSVYCRTACFHYDSLKFFDHYLRQISLEQGLLNGAVPFFVPLPKLEYHEGINPFYITSGVCLWGDVACILPWVLYEYYGDIGLLKEHYHIMCNWVDYISERSSKNKVKYLWQNDRQLGDWLALDNGDINNPIGNTDTQMIASAFYYYSTYLTHKAAKELNDEREKELEILTDNIKNAFIDYYYYKNNIDSFAVTQTACALLLEFRLYPDEYQSFLVNTLNELIEDNNGLLSTGFVGTPFLTSALSNNGSVDNAYKLLLNEKYPGWLFEVNLGATTVWERWNSLDKNGIISGTEMNSLNHYAYGSIVDWMYRNMCGFNPTMDSEIKMTIKPLFTKEFSYVNGEWDSIYGKYKCSWYCYNDSVKLNITIPFNANAKVVLPDSKVNLLDAGNYEFNIQLGL